ncbi:MAG: sigma-54 dependent transcriptional regulator, partial [Desulfomonile sp.]|nr:sigma-54 dependent transcriptional regulator [Desulfomonile sp.]
METMNRILVVDDDASVRESVEMFLRDKGLAVETAETGDQGLRACLETNPPVVILDIRLPDFSGLDVLKGIMANRPNTKVIMITAFHDMVTTIEAMRNGAYDYIHKPLDADELDHAVSKALRISKASFSCPSLLGENQEEILRDRIVGGTPEMRSIFKSIGLLSCNRATVLIEGETGTGKELIARMIHEFSSWRDQPFVTVDCTTLVENLLETELFGHRKGAFTGAVQSKRGRLELAGSGTVFLDEVGDLSPNLQAKFLRFLEYREFTRVGGSNVHRFDARIIAATNRNLQEMVQQGIFRQDLFFRLRVAGIRVPPLRERVADIPELMRFFLAKINQELGARVRRAEERVTQLLQSYSWPGNVRELKNVLTTAVLESRGEVLLSEAVEAVLKRSTAQLFPAPELCSMDELEREHIRMVLQQSRGNLSAA